MNSLWKLVLITVIGAGVSRGNDIGSVLDLSSEENRPSPFLFPSDPLITPRFQCLDKPSGYYADPRYECKVFHFCHEDGKMSTIFCDREGEKHKICIFREIAYHACEGSEIYLALPQDLAVEPTKDTTASEDSSTTDFWLPKVLPAPSEVNQSTTPLSLELRNSSKSPAPKEVEGIFEVINTVLREIQAQKKRKTFKEINPSVYSRGSAKGEESSIRRDDFVDKSEIRRTAIDRSDYMVEVNHRRNEKLLDEASSAGRSEDLFFIPKSTRLLPGDNPRRKRRAAIERYSASRPYAVIYSKVSDDVLVSKPSVSRKSTNHHKDIGEVPFVAARVPADVPTVPITIETRRKKKSKSKKKKNKSAPQTFYITEDSDREFALEQQNVLYYSPEQAPGIGLQDPHGRGVIETRHRPRQNSAQNTNSLPQHSYQTPQSSQNSYPFQLQNFPFQPAAFLSDLAPPQYFLEHSDLQQRGQYPPYEQLPGRLILQPQPNQVERPQATRDVENRPQPQRHPENGRQRRPSQNEGELRNARPPSGRNPEIVSSQIQPRRPVENVSQEHVRRPPPISEEPGNSSPRPRQRSRLRPQTYRPEMMPPASQEQLPRQPEGVEPHPIRQPQLIQPQPIGQLQSIPFRTMPGVPFQQPPVHNPPERRPHPDASQRPRTAAQNAPPEDPRGYQQRPPDVPPPQRFPAFENPFFQNFPGFGTFPFNEPFAQPGPQPYGPPPPPGSRFQEQQVPPQNIANQERPREHVQQQPGPPLREQVFQQLGSPREQPPSPPGPPRGSPSPPHHMREQVPGNQVEEGIGYVPQHLQNPNLIEADRPRSERPRMREHIMVAIPQPARPSRTRDRPSSTEPFLRGHENIRHRDQPQRNPNYREPESVRVQERPPPQSSRRPQVDQLLNDPNERRHRYPSSTTAAVTDSRLQHSTQPQRIRDEHREVHNARQLPRQRVRQNFDEEQQLSTHRHRPTTPLPRQREHPTRHPVRESYARDPRPPSDEFLTTVEEGRPSDRYRSSPPPREALRMTDPPHDRTRSSHERPRTSIRPNRRPETSPPHHERSRQPESGRLRSSADSQSNGSPVTGRYFVTNPPRFVQPVEENFQPYYRPEDRPERPKSRPQEQIERPPPPEFVHAQSLPEKPRPHRYHNSYNSQHRPVVENDLNALSERPSERTRDRPQQPEDVRTRHRGPSRDRDIHSPEIENGFLPVTERPTRKYFQTTLSPQDEFRESDFERHQIERQRIPTTRAPSTPKPTQKRKPPPPRPTFPSFPTFPPPPKRTVTSPKPLPTEENFRHPSTEPEEIPPATPEPSQRFRSEVPSHRYATTTESDLPTHFPEVTTRRRTRKRKRPRTTTVAFEDEDADEAIDAVTQATTRREATTRSVKRSTTTPSPSTTRSTPSNYNRWRQQTTAKRKSTTTPAPDTTPALENPEKTEEYGSRLNLFGRQRGRKPTSFAPKTSTPTPLDSDRRTNKADRTRRPFVKKVRKKVTTDAPDAEEPIARSDEDEDTLQFVADLNSLHEMESVTQLTVEESPARGTEPYGDRSDRTTTLSVPEDATTTQPDDADDFESTRSVSKKFQTRPRILKFGKPRLRPTESILNLSVGGSKAQ